MTKQKRPRRGTPCLCPDGIVRRAVVPVGPVDGAWARISVRDGERVAAIAGTLRHVSDGEPQFKFIPWPRGKNAHLIRKART